MEEDYSLEGECTVEGQLDLTWVDFPEVVGHFPDVGEILGDFPELERNLGDFPEVEGNLGDFPEVLEGTPIDFPNLENLERHGPMGQDGANVVVVVGRTCYRSW